MKKIIRDAILRLKHRVRSTRQPSRFPTPPPFHPVQTTRTSAPLIGTFYPTAAASVFYPISFTHLYLHFHWSDEADKMPTNTQADDQTAIIEDSQGLSVSRRTSQTFFPPEAKDNGNGKPAATTTNAQAPPAQAAPSGFYKTKFATRRQDFLRLMHKLRSCG